jgi:hypothetical protein
VPTEEGEGVEMEGRVITPRSTVSSAGLRQRLGTERLNYGTTEEDFAQYRDVPLEEPAPEPQLQRVFPRANPPPEAPTAPSGISSASEAELNEAEASRTQLTSDLDDLISQSKAQQASVNQAEEQITQVEGEDTATTEAELGDAEAMEGEVSTEAELGEAGMQALDTAEGAEVAGEAGIEGAEGGFGALEAGVVETAGGEEVAGAGPEDPIADVVAGATLAIGTIGVGIASLFGAGRPAQYKNISGTSMMSSGDIANALTKVKAQLATQTAGSPTYNGLLALQNSLTNNTTVVSFNDPQGKPDIAVPLSTPQLATAIKVYQQNPNAYLGMSPTKLQILGLSPEMSKGSAGATQTSIGFIPTLRSDGATWTSGAGGGNWTDFYTTKGQSIFSSNSSIDTLAVPDAQQQKQMNDNYITKVSQIIDNESDPSVKAYLNYQLDVFKYNNGYIPDKPPVVPKPTGASSPQISQLTDALNNKRAQLQIIQNSINTKQSIIDGINTQISGINAQNQLNSQQQLQSYQTQANAYNQKVAQNIETSEQQTAGLNIFYARATNTPLNAGVGRYLTNTQIQSFQNQLATGQITTTGVNPIASVPAPVISTTASGSPIVPVVSAPVPIITNQLQTVKVN